jgi:flagellar basal-body rod protein FlgB
LGERERMTTQNLTVLNAMSQKMGWLEENQKVLAQNIANADTPGYRPQELKQLEFKDLLKTTTSKLSLGTGSPGVAKTDAKHIDTNGSGQGQKLKESKQRDPYEVAPAGNAVILEEQLLKMNENYSDHRLITNLYQKNIDMLKTSVRDRQ